MFKYSPFLLLFIFFRWEKSLAQSSKKDTSSVQNSISVTGFYGLKIFSAEKNYMAGNYWGTEVAYNLNLKNNLSDWVKMLNAKNLSFAFSYFNLDNVYLTQKAGTKGFLGDDYSLFSRLELSIIQFDKVDFLLTPGFGLTYATKTYRTNYNPLIGSHINLGAQIGLKLETPVSASTKIQLGLNFFHYSNAAFKLPNDGVNTINSSIGIISDIGYKETPHKTLAFNIDNKSAFEFGLGLGHRGLLQIVQQKLSPADSIKQEYAVSHLNNAGFYAGYNYRLNSLLSIKAATDVVYYFVTYNAVNYLSKISTSQELGTSYDKFSVGTSLGGDIWLGRFVFEADYGYYLHLKYGQTPIYTYWNFGAKYYLTNWLALEAKEYLHGTEAHYANFGLLFHVY